MNYIRRLFVLFQQRTRRLLGYTAIKRPNALENSLLARLPTEILQQIAEDLPPASAALFSLCCRQIYLLIGTQYLEILSTLHDQQTMFLNLLENDLQDQIACIPCGKLHRIRNAKIYTENGRLMQKAKPNCLTHDRYEMVTSYIHKNFSSSVFKMAMKHYHYFGRDSRSRQLLKLLSGTSHSNVWRPLYREQKTTCQIKDGSLFTCERVTFYGKCANADQRSIELWICPHLEIETVGQPDRLCIKSSYSFPFENKWSTLIHHKNNTATKNTPWSLSTEIQQCRYCRTEYKASFEHDDGCTINFVITIWKDLGQGPESEEWKAHLYHEYTSSSPQPIQFQGGKMASVFQ